MRNTTNRIHIFHLPVSNNTSSEYQYFLLLANNNITGAETSVVFALNNALLDCLDLSGNKIELISADMF
jgi:hypothetical protein